MTLTTRFNTVPDGRAVEGIGLKHLIVGIAGSNPNEGVDVSSVVFVLCCACSDLCDELSPILCVCVCV